MSRTLIIAVLAVLALDIGTAAATPQQAARIKQLTTQVKKQQAAINQRNATLAVLRGQLGSTTIDRDTARTDLANTQAAVTASAAQQVSVMTPAQAWSLLASIRARLASVANFSVTFDNSNFGTFSSQTYIFGRTIGL